MRVWRAAFDKYRKPYWALNTERFELNDVRKPELERQNDDLSFVVRLLVEQRVREIDSLQRTIDARFSRDLRRLQHKHRKKRSRQ